VNTLWEDNKIKWVLSLCDKSGQFLFQVLPDVFPQGRVTNQELLLWEKYYEEKELRRKQKNGRC